MARPTFDLSKYRLECDKGVLPSGLSHLSHKLHWPIDQCTGLGDCFGEREFHTGVDLICPPNTLVKAVQGGRVRGCFPYERQGESGGYGLYAHSDEGIVWSLIHLTEASIERFKGTRHIGGDLPIGENDPAGLVIQWPNENQPTHLHLETAYFPEEWPLYPVDVRKMGEPFNPLLLLEKL